MTDIPIARLLVATASLCLAPPVAAEPSPEPAAIAQRLLDTLRDTTAVPGMAAAVWHDGRIVWDGASGLRDVERSLPVTPDTRFRLASVSKLFTATAAAKLAEQGKLDLDAPVQAQLPWLGGHWPAMTPRQLAAHISGLPHYQDGDDRVGERHYATGRDAVGIFAGRPLLSAPGTAYSYSSWGYTLLGTLVEERAGMPFTDYVSRSLVPGLAIGADATHSGDPDASRAYAFEGGSVIEAAANDFSYSWGGGGLSATAKAVASFGGRMIEGQIVAPATFDAMLVPTPLTNGAAASERDYRVGLGWRLGRDGDGASFVHHSGITWGARSTLGIWREEGTAVSLLSNAEWVSRIEPTAMMLAAPFRPEPGGSIRVSCPLEAQRYSGTFGDVAVAGAATFRIEGGLCTGKLEQDAALNAYFATAMQRSNAPLTIVALDPRGGLARAGIVNPFGIADLRAQEDGSFAAQVTSTRRLVIRFARGSDQPGK